MAEHQADIEIYVREPEVDRLADWVACTVGPMLALEVSDSGYATMRHSCCV